MKLNRVLDRFLAVFNSVSYSFCSAFLKNYFKSKAFLRAFQLSSLTFLLFITVHLQGGLVGDANAQAGLPDCNTFSSGQATVDSSGDALCLYRGLPRCDALGTRTPVSHRENCYDVIDLPVCELISDPTQRQPLRNCVRKCSHADFSSSNLAIYNRNCIRYCDEMPSNTANVGANCSQRLCHQLPISQAPLTATTTSTPSNCQMTRCDRLWPKEHERLFLPGVYDHPYCDGSVKCYDFPQSLLQYSNLTLPDNRKICQNHTCPPSVALRTSGCGRNDEFARVAAMPAPFRSEYDDHVTDIQNDTTNIVYAPGDPQYGIGCLPLTVCPISTFTSVIRDVKICENTSGSVTDIPTNRTVADQLCDPPGTDGHECQVNNPTNGQQIGYCFRTVDCRNAANVNEQVCIDLARASNSNQPSSPTSSAGHVVDEFNSSFYRPTPSPKAIGGTVTILGEEYNYIRGYRGSGNGNVDPAGLCYHADASGVNHITGRRSYVMDFGELGSITFYNYDLFEDSMSPGLCGLGDNADRGRGYVYLKGTDSLLYNAPDSDTMYQKGQVTTVFDNNLATHTTEFCLRFKNAVCLQCQGQRECVPTIANTHESPTQICGRDVCRTFSMPVDVTDSGINPQSCMMTDQAAGNALPPECSAEIDNYIRMRAVYYSTEDEAGGRRGVICGYLDAKGHLAYEPGNVDMDRGNRDIGDGRTCQNDTQNTADSDGGCQGYDSATNPGVAHLWRNLKRATFVGNNQPPDSPRHGYYDRDGNFFQEQFCSPTEMRRGSGLLFNLANLSNSPTMLNPPIVIVRVNRIYGYGSSTTTDFHRPEVLVQYGSNPIEVFNDTDVPTLNANPPPTSTCYASTDSANCPRASELTGYNQTFLSLKAGEISGANGTDNTPGGNGPDSPAYARIFSEVPGVVNRISTEVYLQKDYDNARGIGTVCVYQKTRDGNGNVSPNPLKVGCVDRRRPIYYIHWNAPSNAVVGIRSPVPAYSPPVGSSIVPPPSVSSVPSDFVEFNIDRYDVEYCTSSIESYRFCIKRGFCTQLAKECSDASTERSRRILSGATTARQDAIIARCEDTVLPQCLEERGLSREGNVFDILRTNEHGAHRCRNTDSAYLEGSGVTDANSTLPACAAGESPFLYGWSNVYEVTRGHENFLRHVIAHKVPDGRMGICRVRLDSNNLIDTVSGSSNPDISTNCLAGGGDNGDCVCDFVSEDHIVSDPSKFIVRPATPKEVRLAVPIPVRNVCRTFSGIDQVPPVGEGFPSTNIGSTAVGSCDLANGWEYVTNANYQDLFPTMNCINDPAPGASRFEGVWDMSSMRNRCVRRSCNISYAGNPDIQGNYTGSYDDSENLECKGARSGFANWNNFRPGNTVGPLQFIANADSCIAGFKPFGSTPILDVSGFITSYRGGLLPRRICNVSNGQYGALARDSVDLADSSCSTRRVLTSSDGSGSSFTSSSRTRGCVRISCPAINPPVPTSISDRSAWNAWFASGGASFPTVNASRNSEYAQNSSSTGICNTAIGFFEINDSLGNAISPVRECDHLGNWSQVISNPCISLTCDEITTSNTNSSHGFSTWNEVTEADMATVIAGGNNARQEMATSCVTTPAVAATSTSPAIPEVRRVQNPYPPAVDELGAELPNANDLTRPAEMPKRYCVGGSSGGTIYRIWRSPSNPCISQCPGHDVDSREGVGVTTHASSAGPVTLQWPSTDFGADAYVSNWTGSLVNLNASDFLSGRTNGLYLMKRRCGSDGRWEDPLAMCALNNGPVGAANFRLTGDLGYSNSIRSYTDGQYSALSSTDAADNVTGVCSVSTLISESRRSEILAAINSLPNAIPSLYCRMPINNFIDKTFLDRQNNTSDCGICSPPTNPSSINSRLVIAPENRPYYPGETVAISRVSCNQADGFYATSNSSLAPPTAVCDPGGTGVWSAQNSNSCARSCNITSSFLMSQNVGASDLCLDGGASYEIRSNDISTGASGQLTQVMPGEVFEFTAYRSCNRASSTTGAAPDTTCSYWRYAAICQDGNILINQNTDTVNTQCPYSQFLYTPPTWGVPRTYGPLPNRYFTAYRHLQRTSSVATGLGMLRTDGTILDMNVACTNCPSPVMTIGAQTQNPTTPAASWITPVPGSSSTGGSGSGSGAGSSGGSIDITTGSGITGSGSSDSVLGTGLSVVDSNLYSPENFTPTFTTNCARLDPALAAEAVYDTSIGNYTPGTSITGTCSSGASLTGANIPVITCQENGDWLIADNDCTTMCPAGDHFTGDHIFNVPNNSPSRIPGNARVIGACRVTHTLHANGRRPTMACQSHGSWRLHDSCRPRTTGRVNVTFRPVFYHNGTQSNIAVTTNSLFSGNMTGGSNGDHRYWVTHYGSFDLRNLIDPRATIVLNIRTIDNRLAIRINGVDLFNTPHDGSLRAANEVPHNRAIAVFPHRHGWSNHIVSPWDPHRGGSRSLPRMRITITKNANGTTSTRLQGLRYDWMNDHAGQGLVDLTLSSGGFNNVPFRHGHNDIDITAYDGALGDHINIDNITITEQ